MNMAVSRRGDLHMHPEVAEDMQKKIQDSERDRKAMAGLVSKAAKERAKKINVNVNRLIVFAEMLLDSTGEVFF